MYEPSQLDDNIKLKLPEPAGYRLLIALPDVSKTTAGGVHMPDTVTSAEEVASILGFVLKVGPQAYGDPERFPDGPWCKEGDFVIFRAYSGTRFKIMDKEFRLINDDTVEAVVDDPRGFRRA